MTSSFCESWQAARSSCLDVKANLTSIMNQEENTYIQHRHGGDTGWIGLQDIWSEGNFTWIDRAPVNFTYWAPNQPNGFQNDQDCVHTLGLGHGYQWNDVTCAACHTFTCKRGNSTENCLFIFNSWTRRNGVDPRKEKR